MIILSQDKRKIINFNNIIGIIINKYSNACPDITCCTLKDFEIILGEYATEERAKEVLQEIIKAYRDYRTAECDGYTNVLQETVVYEMPEK